VLLVSSELPEIIGLSDRVVVIREGGVSAIVDRENSNEEHLLRYAMVDEKDA
jgi:ABC-type sugar transport system ATPase subunit